MSRFYRILVGPATGITPAAPSPANQIGEVWTNRLADGRADLGAQQIEIDAWFYGFDTPISQGALRIWGPSKEQIAQASDFNGAPIVVYAGMQPGLPLASVQSPQSGIVLSGSVFQAFANWQGVNQTLDFVVITDGGATQANPSNISFRWDRGEQMSAMIDRTLSQGYPQYSRDIQIGQNIAPTETLSGVYPTIQDFAAYVKGASRDAVGQQNYPGVSITLANGIFYVFDGTSPQGEPKPITVQDLIGQPTWLGPNTISFNTVMRADLRVGSRITFPPSTALNAITNAQSFSNVRAKNTFTGIWNISLIRHVGNSRAPDAQSWISNFQAYTIPQ